MAAAKVTAPVKPPEKKLWPNSKFDRHLPYRKLYDTARWKKVIRPAVLRRDPICVDPHKIGCHKPATVADHKFDHRGDAVLFYCLNNLQGVCDACHNFKTGSEHGSNRNPNQAIIVAPALVDGKVKDYGSEQAGKVTGPKKFIVGS